MPSNRQRVDTEYKWIKDFDGKALTLPAASKMTIEIVRADGSASEGLHCNQHAQINSNLPFARSDCFLAKIIEGKQLVNADGDDDIKDVYELTLQIPVSNLI